MIPLIPLLSPLLDKVLSFIPNANEREKAKLEFELKVQENETKILELFMQSDVIQAEINKAEAANSNIFVSGWRPFIGWVCGVSFTWAFLLEPIIVFIFSASGHPLTDLPKFDISTMSTVLLGMLGLGGMRTFEKFKGVARK